ncbi:MAG: hypothetical protein K9G49_07795 [Taibaiella sp.]|nr:hypothetical protein [Taibaiella sp.]
MKQILFVCCMLAAVGNDIYAQQQSVPVANAPVPVSKSEFAQKVKELNKLLGKDKIEDANALFTTINKMANTQLGQTRLKMKEAQNDADKKKYAEATTKQRIVFADALRLKQENMAGNRKLIIDKLNEFVDMM